MHAKTVQNKLCFFEGTQIQELKLLVFMFSTHLMPLVFLYTPRNIRKSYEMGFGDHVTSLSFLKKNKIYWKQFEYAGLAQ